MNSKNANIRDDSLEKYKTKNPPIQLPSSMQMKRIISPTKGHFCINKKQIPPQIQQAPSKMIPQALSTATSNAQQIFEPEIKESASPSTSLNNISQTSERPIKINKFLLFKNRKRSISTSQLLAKPVSEEIPQTSFKNNSSKHETDLLSVSTNGIVSTPNIIKKEQYSSHFITNIASNNQIPYSTNDITNSITLQQKNQQQRQESPLLKQSLKVGFLKNLITSISQYPINNNNSNNNNNNNNNNSNINTQNLTNNSQSQNLNSQKSTNKSIFQHPTQNKLASTIAQQIFSSNRLLPQVNNENSKMNLSANTSSRILNETPSKEGITSLSQFSKKSFKHFQKKSSIEELQKIQTQEFNKQEPSNQNTSLKLLNVFEKPTKTQESDSSLRLSHSFSNLFLSSMKSQPNDKLAQQTSLSPQHNFFSKVSQKSKTFRRSQSKNNLITSSKSPQHKRSIIIQSKTNVNKTKNLTSPTHKIQSDSKEQAQDPPNKKNQNAAQSIFTHLLAVTFKNNLMERAKRSCQTLSKMNLRSRVQLERLEQYIFYMHREYNSVKKVSSLIYQIVYHIPYLLNMLFRDDQMALRDKIDSQYVCSFLTNKDRMEQFLTPVEMKSDFEQLVESKILSDIAYLNEKLCQLIEKKFKDRFNSMRTQIVEDHMSVQFMEKNLQKRIAERNHQQPLPMNYLIQARHNYKGIDHYSFQTKSQHNLTFSNSFYRSKQRFGEFAGIDEQNVVISGSLDQVLDKINCDSKEKIQFLPQPVKNEGKQKIIIV